MKYFFLLLSVILAATVPAYVHALDNDGAPEVPQQIEKTANPEDAAVEPFFLPTLQDPADVSGFFFAAEQLRQQTKDKELPDSSLRSIEFMYLLAFRFAKGPAAVEAGKSLFAFFFAQGRYAEASDIARDWINEFGPDWNMYRNIYDAFIAQNDATNALAVVGELSKVLPSAAKNRATELAWMEYNARSKAHDYSWAVNGPPFIKTKYPDIYTSKIFRLYADWSDAPQNLMALARFRAAANEKNYSEATASAIPILSTLSATDTPRVWISELGKSLYGAGAFQNGMEFFSAALGFQAPSAPEILSEPNTSPLPVLNRERISTENRWVMAFYLARMYQGIKDTQTAASLYIELVPLSFSNDDSDSALWYWLDITMDTIAATNAVLDDLGQDEANSLHAMRALEISALTQASILWKKPSFFEDIVGEYMRQLLRESAWDDVVRLCALMSQKLTPALRGPLLYLSGRLIETGRSAIDLASESDFWRWLNPADSAANEKGPSIYYRAILRENGIEEHYRTLAAWRLSIEPSILANAPVLGQSFDIESAIASLYPDAQSPPVRDDALKDSLDFIDQSLNFGLETLAANQTAALSSFNNDALLWLAMKFVEHEQYYPALRIGRETLNRKAFSNTEISYALLYPRAWPQHFIELSSLLGIAEPLVYAIVRSESLFNQKAVSRSGAVGLSQLLPGTAEETAKGLKMSSYALFDPRDNLTIGLTYYGYMLQRFANKPTRAIAAYNAGPSRMAQWTQAWGSLEDDLLIELYPVEEPRQYTKNITSAALYYGKMYYGIAPQDMLDFIYGMKPLPSAANAPSVEISTSESPTSATPDTVDH